MRCNGAGAVRYKRTLSWHPSWIFIFLFIGGIPVVVILALILGKRAKVELSLCEHHAKKRNKTMAIWFGLSLLSVVVAGLGFWQEAPAVGGFALLAALIFLIGGAVVTPLVQPKKIDAHYVWLKKISPAFLAEFPAA